jgi:DNA-binding NarL/FixJ family response regulator
VLGEYQRISSAPGREAVQAPALTARETEVLRLVAKGHTYPEIAERLVLSVRTVQNHVQNTLTKLQLHNKAQLVRYALEQGLDDE